MRVKLDENVPTGLSTVLRESGHETTTVPQQGLAGQSDAVIWDAAQRENRLLVTLDLDFADIRSLPPGSHQGVIVRRPSRQGRRAIRELLQALLAQHDLDTFKGSLVIAEEHRIRVRRS
jgi:predicted nuclease of predicted toxin-antitoxin system